jgi:hypothetical protein
MIWILAFINLGMFVMYFVLSNRAMDKDEPDHNKLFLLAILSIPFGFLIGGWMLLVYLTFHTLKTLKLIK